MSRRADASLTITAELPADARLVALGPAALAVHVWALGFCAREESDGRIPSAALAGCPWPSPDGAARSLVEAGLWREVAGGFELPAFLELNESRERLEERRRLARDRQARKRGGAAALRRVGAGRQVEVEPSLRRVPVLPAEPRTPCADFDDAGLRDFSSGQLEACGCGRCRAEIVRRGEEELRRRGQA